MSFKTAVAAAVAGLAVNGDDLVAEFACGVERAVKDTAVKDHAAADAGAQRDGGDTTQAACGADKRLSPGSGAGVLRNVDRNGEGRLHLCDDRHIAPEEIGRIDNGAGGGICCAGHADADAGEVLRAQRGLPQQVVQRDNDGGDDGVAAALRGRGRLCLMENAAVGIDETEFDIGPTDVDADVQGPASHERLQRTANAEEKRDGCTAMGTANATCLMISFFVLRNFPNAVGVTAAFELRSEPDFDDHFGQLDAHHAGAESQDVGVVVFAGELR